MKAILCIFFAFIILSCNKHNAISKIKAYNEELSGFTNSKNIDTITVNSSFEQFKISSISMDTLARIAASDDFIALLKTERKLLNKWSRIPNFKSYQNSIQDDTLISLIRRCSAFDRSPSNTERIPSLSGMRTVSLAYYKIEVPVAFHIITSRDGEGVLPDMTAKIITQMKVLNDEYNKFNISFKLVSTETTVNDDWYNNASYYTNPNSLKQMTTSLSKAPAKVMNVYTLGSQQVLGEATYPWYTENGTTMDYIVINFNTLPGGPITFYNGQYNEGKTLVHEVGHFLGLFHTFEGGNFLCNTSPPHNGCSIGDQVDDTPSQQICYFEGCDLNADSCPSPGKDPVKNFMGYNPDACMSEFTPGQRDRLLQCIIKWRYYLIINPI